MASSFDTQVHVEEMIPECPVCGLPLDGLAFNGMHLECGSSDNEFFVFDFESELAQDGEPSEDDIDYYLRSYYGF